MTPKMTRNCLDVIAASGAHISKVNARQRRDGDAGGKVRVRYGQ